MTLATQHQPRHNAPVPFNSGAGRENPIPKADNRREGGFFVSEHRYWCAFSMAGSSGEAASSGPVSFGLVSHPCCYLPAAPAVRSVWQVNRPKEATMPSITRALSRHFPIVKTLAFAVTLDEAKAIARLHLGRTGRAVRIQSAEVGFQVAEVR